MCIVHYICVWCHRDQKRVLDSLKLKIKIVVSCHMSAGTQIVFSSTANGL